MPEDTSGIFKPEAKKIESIFRDTYSFYQVPDYQRPYSWENEQIEQLWEDFYSAMETQYESYFLGPMILVRQRDEDSGEYFEVVDGQQRLTTLTILFCVIRDLYGNKLEELDQELKARIEDAIKAMVGNKPRLTLIIQDEYQNEFEQDILNRVKWPPRELTKKERRDNKFINAALIFKQKLEELEEQKGIEGIKKLTNYILKNVEMITITCSRRDYAIKLFQVINTRGLDLSPADLIKSTLYSRLDQNKRGQFNNTWKEIEIFSTQMDESLDNLLTYYEYYLLAQNPKHSLIEELTDKFNNLDPNEVIHEFKKFVKSFNEICNMESPLRYSFEYLPNQVFWKAILTSAKYEEFQDFEGLCRLLRKLYYSYWIAGYTTSKIKQLSFNLIGWIKEKRPLDEIGKDVERKMVEDDVLRRMSENLQDDVYGEYWVKPLLALIEYAQTDGSKFFEIDKRVHVDHILPQEWSKEEDWVKMWTPEQAEKWLHKIGNLTLLSGKKNIAQLNDPPIKKAEMYKEGHGGKTAFEISKMIIGQLEQGSWTEKDVEERQRWIIEQVETLLEVKFNRSPGVAA